MTETVFTTYMTNTAATSTKTTPCKICRTPTSHLGMFPGNICLACWRETPEANRMPTADELVRAFGG